MAIKAKENPLKLAETRYRTLVYVQNRWYRRTRHNRRNRMREDEVVQYSRVSYLSCFAFVS